MTTARPIDPRTPLCPRCGSREQVSAICLSFGQTAAAVTADLAAWFCAACRGRLSEVTPAAPAPAAREREPGEEGRSPPP